MFRIKKYIQVNDNLKPSNRAQRTHVTCNDNSSEIRSISAFRMCPFFWNWSDLSQSRASSPDDSPQSIGDLPITVQGFSLSLMYPIDVCFYELLLYKIRFPHILLDHLIYDIFLEQMLHFLNHLKRFSTTCK